MTSQEIHVALQNLYRGWPYIKEFRAGTGLGAGSERYLDAWTMQPFPSLPMTSIAIEIKVSRGDFTKEKRRPMKRDAAMRISNEFYFAAPRGLLTEDDIPDEAGLIEIDHKGEAEITCKSPHRDNLPTWPFVASLARRVYELETQVNGQTPMKALEKLQNYEAALRKWKLNKETKTYVAASDPEPTIQEYHCDIPSLRFMAAGIREKVLGK